MQKQAIYDYFQQQLSGSVLLDAPMSHYTSWRIGGPADVLVEPQTLAEIRLCLQFCEVQAVPLLVLGKGSNLLVRDGGIRGVVLHLGDNFSAIDIRAGGVVYAQAGALLSTLCRQTAKADLVGLEWAVGIPGSVGGAIIMNAGAYGSQIGHFVTSVDIIEYNGSTRQLTGAEMDFAYRHSAVGERQIVTGITFGLPTGDGKEAEIQMKQLLQQRAKNQPLEYPSCGSVFRNPPADHAGRLSEAAGCKGLSCGGAQVSLKHGNFIVNLGGATAGDVLTIIAQVQQQVEAKFGVLLQPEVKIIGE